MTKSYSPFLSWLKQSLLRLGLLLFLLAATFTLAQAASLTQTAADGEALFKAKCAACHTLGGGKLVGPDLQGVTTRRDIAWLTRWLKEPDKMLAEKDAIAVQLLAESNNVPMPNLALSDADVAALLAYFQSTVAPATAPTQPAQGMAPTAGQPLSGSALVAALNGDPDYGQKLFTGEISLTNGGTHCMACHSVEGVGLLGGGALGPDLTHVYTRYGREGLASALGTLPFPTMQGVFANKMLTTSEQADLLAFFARADTFGQPRTQQNLQIILGAGTGLALVLLAGMALFWPRQSLSLSQRLRRYGKL